MSCDLLISVDEAAEDVDFAGGVFHDEEYVQPGQAIVSQWNRSPARIAWAWAVRNCAQVGPVRCGSGSIPAVWRIFHTVEASIR
jgi:hypothetical protein